MGRSPLLATVSVTVLRPALRVMSPSWMKSSPGIMGASHDLENHCNAGDRTGRTCKPHQRTHAHAAETEGSGDAQPMKSSRRDRKASHIKKAGFGGRCFGAV